MKEKYEHIRKILLDLYKYPQNDIEVKRNKYNEYLRSLRILAYRGYSEAQYDLAQHYEDMSIWGAPNPYENISKRFYWYSKAAANNHAGAFNNLADMYERGIGCKKNIKKALEYYKKSGELGDDLGKKNYKILLKQSRNIDI